jgi:cytosine/adenosine deaminase-related metal-dependent hydrolase
MRRRPSRRETRSRRSFLKAGAGVAGAAALAPVAALAQAPLSRQDADLRDGLDRQGRDPRGRILIRNATIITMDPKVGDFAKGDLLIEAGRIADVKPLITASAQVLDATGCIVIPGFGDTHRHCASNTWNLAGLSPLPYVSPPSPRRRLADLPKGPQWTPGSGPTNLQIEPQDVYAATLVSALTCAKSGVTCVMDWAGNSRTPEHADAALQALRDSGIRAVYGYGGANSVSADRPWEDVARVQKQHFRSRDQLVTLHMAMNIRVPEEQTIAKIRFARDHGLRITIDGADWPEQGDIIVRLGNAGYLGPDVTIVHCNDIGETAWKVMADTGTSVSVAPFSEMLIGIANGVPPIQNALDVGIRPSFSSDVFQFSDFFTLMRVAACCQRQRAFEQWYEGDSTPPVPITMRDVVEFATVQGVKANGLLDKCGTLTPGKEADLLLIRANDVNTVTPGNALATVVQAADNTNLDVVMVAGRLRKFRGQVVGADPAKAVSAFQASRERLFARARFTLNVLM